VYFFLYIKTKNKNTTTDIEVRKRRIVVQIPVPEATVTAIVEITAHMSKETPKRDTKLGRTHIKSLGFILYNFNLFFITTLQHSYFLLEADRPQTPVITGYQ
jgi:hypothetical protein